MQEKYHISFGKKRTTITVDIILSKLMAIKFGVLPGSDEAKLLIRAWLQDKLVDRLGEGAYRKSASQYARKYLIIEIADQKLNDERIEFLAKSYK